MAVVVVVVWCGVMGWLWCGGCGVVMVVVMVVAVVVVFTSHLGIKKERSANPTYAFFKWRSARAKPIPFFRS